MLLFACAILDPRLAAAQDPDADRELNLAEPDFTLAALPTTLRLPARAGVATLTIMLALDGGVRGGLYGRAPSLNPAGTGNARSKTTAPTSPTSTTFDPYTRR